MPVSSGVRVLILKLAHREMLPTKYFVFVEMIEYVQTQ